tara:strand:+ start:229 stop:486 length:258 start_codon:yes stop_codon:yes gene_type:complete
MDTEDYNPCVDDFVEMIKKADPEMSRQMKSHYKKKFIGMSEDISQQNLLYKMCLKMYEMEDDLKWYKENYERVKEVNAELKRQKI